MAKNDLVVKLLLDSGAFGNDLRQAERRAQEFGNNMKSAGKTAGDFSKEIGLSTGALGKLGGMLTGAGAVVAAVGAFKSVMESTNATSIKFNSTIAGFEGVLKTFQQSLANFDFTPWLNGMGEVFERYKEWKQLKMETELSDIATDALLTRDEGRIKELEVKFNYATSDSEREKYKKEALAVVAEMRKVADNFGDAVSDGLISAIERLDPNLKKGGITGEKADSLIWEALKKYNDRSYGEVIGQYKQIAGEINNIEHILSWAGGLELQALRDSNVGGGNDALIAEYEKIRRNKDFYRQRQTELIDSNQELFFINAIYKMVAEELSAEISDMMSAIQQGKKADELENTILKWNTSTGSIGGGSTGGSTGGSIKTTTEIKNMEGSIAKMNEDIAAAKKLRDSYLLGSDAWLEEAAKVASLERQLKSMEGEMDKLLSKYKMEPLPELPDLIDQWTENAKNKNNGLAVPKGYKREGGLIVKDVKAPDINVGKIVDELNNMNSALSSSIMLVNGLGAAFASCEDETAQQLAGVSDIVGSVMAGIMSLTQIQQSAIATNNAYALSVATGQAASLPFPANLAAIATVVGTLISVFATIKQMSNNKFAEGGIVGGTSYSGDKLFAMVNSGEMILNKRQQRNLSNMIGGGGGQVEFHISGDSLVGVLNNKRHKTNLTR